MTNNRETNSLTPAELPTIPTRWSTRPRNEWAVSSTRCRDQWQNAFGWRQLKAHLRPVSPAKSVPPLAPPISLASPPPRHALLTLVMHLESRARFLMCLTRILVLTRHPFAHHSSTRSSIHSLFVHSLALRSDPLPCPSRTLLALVMHLELRVPVRSVSSTSPSLVDLAVCFVSPRCFSLVARTLLCHGFFRLLGGRVHRFWSV